MKRKQRMSTRSKKNKHQKRSSTADRGGTKHPREVTELRRQAEDEDGIDPRYLAREARREPGAAQLGRLCSQVERALSLALMADCNDSRLFDLEIRSVTPSPDASRLRVVVGVSDPDFGPIDEALHTELEACLANAHGFLRSAVAEELHRRRVPDLAFVLAHDGEETGNGKEVPA